MAPSATVTDTSPMKFEENKGHEGYNQHVGDGHGMPKYLIVRPEKGGLWDLWRYAVLAMQSGIKFLETSHDHHDHESNTTATATAGQQEQKEEEAADNRWVILMSIIVRKIVAFFGKPTEYVGIVLEFFLNLLSVNGGLLHLFCNFLNGKMEMPQKGTENFLSTIGHLDGRIDLYKAKSLVQQTTFDEDTLSAEMGSKALMDLCIMASKLAYENAQVVQNIVDHHWKMHFVEFYDCWNDFQKEKSTQLFILCDRPKDAKLILISFRGTEPFDADDWITDFDYSWYEIPNVGKVHIGFLEALGLGNRNDAATFQYHLQMRGADFECSDGADIASSWPEDVRPSLVEATIAGYGNIPPEMVNMTAYYAARMKLKSLLKENKDAKFVITGHSLGGALAILFPTVLVLHQEMEVMQRLLGVYTFGQPRIGNMQLGKYMKTHLEYPVPKYFRVVYCNDLVPRLPYDDNTFLYKHFGVCLYYDSGYIEQKMDEEPNRNFFGLRYFIPEHMNAAWELIRSLTMGYTHGPEYKEGWFSLLLRVIGLTLPGISAHCPTDYVNSVRLGREQQ